MLCACVLVCLAKQQLWKYYGCEMARIKTPRTDSQRPIKALILITGSGSGHGTKMKKYSKHTPDVGMLVGLFVGLAPQRVMICISYLPAQRLYLDSILDSPIRITPAYCVGKGMYTRMPVPHVYEKLLRTKTPLICAIVHAWGRGGLVMCNCKIVHLIQKRKECLIVIGCKVTVPHILILAFLYIL